MEKEQIKKAILRTLAYFDLNSYPLTAVEIKNWLYKIDLTGLNTLLLYLDEMKKQSLIQEKNSYFYLFGREEIVENRRRNLVISELKLKKARFAVKFIRCVPFLKAVFVCNTVASGTAKNESDIDFFIITKNKRIWLVRFFTNIILRLFGLRTYGNNNSNKICLSFFIDSNSLNLEKLKAVDNDIHFAFWITQMVPIYDTDSYWKKFLSANYWLKDYFPNLLNSYNYSSIVGPGCFAKVWKKIWEVMWYGFYGDLLEKQARDLQLQKMKLKIKEKANAKDNGVVLSDKVIKLHENDTRKTLAIEWEEKIKTLGAL